MKIHLAGAEQSYEYLEQVMKYNNNKLNWNLYSYIGLKDNPLAYEKFLITSNASRSVLIDSGAFSFQSGRGKPNWIKYTKEYANFIQENDNEKIHGYFEMDIDNIIGYDNVLILREMLDEVTDKIIPVWHRNRGIKDFKETCEKYNYISVTGKSCDINTDQFKMFVDYAHKHNTRIHGLGITGKVMLNKVPFDSVDSTTWLSGVRYAHMDNQQLDSEYTSNNRHKICALSYIRWMKKQNDYYRKWYKVCDWERTDGKKYL